MNFKSLARMAIGAGLASALLAPVAMADVSSSSSVSSNWSGYRAATQDGSGFTHVAGSWVEPSVDCSTATGHASFWVGLGGSNAGDAGSAALEQTGTAIDCDASGNATHTAWYELLPAPPVQLDLKVSPGDHMSASVTVNGTNVTMTVSNATTGQSTTKNLTMTNPDPDLSTAEWIAEAPSRCDGGGCQPLTLANFGKVAFSNAIATSSGHTGTISDPAWAAEPVALSPSAGMTQVATDGGSGGAQPSQVSSDGSSFSVSYVGSDPSAGGNGYDPSAGGYGYDPGAGGYGWSPGGVGIDPAAASALLSQI